MTNPVLLSCQQLVDEPVPNSCSDINTCSECGEKVWHSCLTQHHFQREGYTNYVIICGRCLEPTKAVKLRNPLPPSIALHALAKSTNFFPPAQHTATTCAQCNQPAWAKIRDVKTAARWGLEVHYYCDICTDSICAHPK